MPAMRLKTTHTHAGVTHPAGQVLDVAPHTARWLLDHGIAEPCDPASASASAPAMASSRPAKPISKE